MPIKTEDLAAYVARSQQEVRDSGKTFEEFWADRGVNVEEMSAFWAMYVMSAVSGKPRDAMERPELFWTGVTLRAFLAGATLARRELRDLVGAINAYMDADETDKEGRRALDALSELLGRVNA